MQHMWVVNSEAYPTHTIGNPHDEMIQLNLFPINTIIIIQDKAIRNTNKW